MNPNNEHPASDRLVSIAEDRFRFGRSTDGQTFAVAKSGANVAVPFSGQEQHSLRSVLAKAYRDTYSKVPSASQLTDAIQVLLGTCHDSPAERCFRRVAPCPDGGVAVDLGRSDGQTVLIYPYGPVRWRIADRSPVLFQRSPLTGEMPLPEHGGSLQEIPALLGLQDRHWELALGWMLAAYEPDAPHPLLAIFGPAGAGKSSLARLIVAMCDPSPCPLKTVPTGDEQLHMTATSAWVYALDNVSELKPWLQDALCQASTGTARAARMLYSSRGLTVTALKVPIILTAIECGTLRGDFGDRMVMLELQKRQEATFRAETDLTSTIQSRLPFWLGALFDAFSQVMEHKPICPLVTCRSRMADFAHILACADKAGVTRDAYGQYLRNRQDAVQEIAEGDELVDAISTMLQQSATGEWQGSATALLHLLNKRRPDGSRSGWPNAANHLSQRLRRLDGALLGCGVRYSAHREGDSRKMLISLSLSKKENISSGSLASACNAAESLTKPQRLPDDTGVTPERSPDDDWDRSPVGTDDTRTITERWPTAQSPLRQPARPSSVEALRFSPQDQTDLTACPKCRSKQVVDVSIHDGESTRRDCGKCHAFIGFPVWKSPPSGPTNTLRSTN